MQFFLPIDAGFYKQTGFWIMLLEYPIWALLQQTVMQAFFFRRFRTIVSPTAWPAILSSGILFSAIHIPNPPLMTLTFVGGVVWSWAYLKHPNVFTLAVSHNVLGVACYCVFLIYGPVGLFADIRWSKIRPVSYRVETINGETADKGRTQHVSKKENGELVVVGWVRGTAHEVEEVFVRFDGVNYPAVCGLEREHVEAVYGDPYRRHTGFRVQIPIGETKLGHYVFSLRVQLKGKRLHLHPSKKFWVRILLSYTEVFLKLIPDPKRIRSW